MARWEQPAQTACPGQNGQRWSRKCQEDHVRDSGTVGGGACQLGGLLHAASTLEGGWWEPRVGVLDTGLDFLWVSEIKAGGMF